MTEMARRRRAFMVRWSARVGGQRLEVSGMYPAAAHQFYRLTFAPAPGVWPKMGNSRRRHGVREPGRQLGASTCTCTTKACIVNAVATAWRNGHDPLPDCHRCRLQEVPGVFHLPAEDCPRRCTEARRNSGQAGSGREEVASLASPATRPGGVATPVCRAPRAARAGRGSTGGRLRGCLPA